MPDDPNGTHFLPPSYKVVDGDDVLPIQHNPPLEDLSQGLTNRLHKDGRTAWTGDQNANGNKLTGLADGTADTDAATVGQAAVSIGDGKWSARELDATWLRRDGALYESDDYPDLAAILPSLPDGIVWSNRTISGRFKGIANSDDGFVALTNTDAQASSDGINWTIRNSFTGGLISNDIAFGGGIYLALMFDGSEDTNGYVTTSLDGDNWSTPTVRSPSGRLNAAAYGDGMFVMVGEYGQIVTTDDGSSFTVQDSGVSDWLYGVHYNGSDWIAVGAGGTILTSPDAENWTARTSGTTETLHGVYSYGGTAVVVGRNGTIITSSNLAGWTARSSGTSQDFNAVIANANGYLAIGDSGTARLSSNLTTWTAAPTGSSASLDALVIDPSNDRRYLVAGASNLVLDGLRTDPTQFRVPEDDPDYGWIKALNEVPA
ncbi:hypothetical protein GCM10007989_07290 [Devosia pacifica]|uniref:Uncharacterized protein n=1 Tax=Devosia pacifica TaxID=1335967 RepID=A0A918RXI3_9HYPH|nr:hypothetical protein [Devosia pacifica]GHA15081.1 hypothetical protein GCM10007989_07290 [Devosia pacifica]